MLKRKKVKPITLRDVTIIDDSKLKKAITAASLGNAMEWFDFWDMVLLRMLLVRSFPRCQPQRADDCRARYFLGSLLNSSIRRPVLRDAGR